MAAPRTVSELFPSKWLSPADLQRPVLATIAAVDVEELRQADGSREPKLVITWKNSAKRMVANKTQAGRLAELLGTEVFSQWVGARVKLSKGRASNGKDTIVVLEAVLVPAPGQQQPPAAPEPAQQPQNGAGQDDAALWAPRDPAWAG